MSKGEFKTQLNESTGIKEDKGLQPATNPPPMPPVNPPARVNPLLENIRIPGETFALPSRGIFYQSGELSPEVLDGEVHVYPMTTIDEIVMRSPDKLFSGEAIKEVFGRCIPQIGNTSMLLAKDADFLMVALRKVSYGSIFEVNFNHECNEEDSKNHIYSVDIDTFLKNAKNIDPQEVAKSFTETLPNNQKVLLQPMRMKDLIDLMQARDVNSTPEKTHQQLIKSILGMVRSVDGIKDRDLIYEWLCGIQIKWIKSIADAIEKSSDWGIDFTIKQKCKDCGEEITISVPLNPMNFFT